MFVKFNIEKLKYQILNFVMFQNQISKLGLSYLKWQFQKTTLIGYSKYCNLLQLIINMEEVSNITIKFEMITNEYETWQTAVIAIVWLVLETIGNGLLLSLIHYYKFGGDPLKWRIVDLVSTYISLQLLFKNSSQSLHYAPETFKM